MKNSKGFNLIAVIVIICIVSIVSGITTGIIVMNTYVGVSSTDNDLNEFLRVYSDLVENYYEDVDKKAMLDKAMDAMLEYLGDSYTTYLSSDEREALEERLNGYQGIGVSFANRTVVSVSKGSPAEKAGLLEGDVFLKIDGEDVSNMSDDEMAALIKKSGKDSVNVIMLRGEETREFSLEIKTLYSDPISYNMIDGTSIGYISIPIFSRNIANQTKDAVKELEEQGMSKLIIDLRNDTGGYLDEAQNLANIFLKKNKLIYSLEGKNGKDDYYDKTEESTDFPIVVLLNEVSASASEILAGALKDSYGATIVGTKSYGKGKVQQTYNLNGGGMAKYTSAKWFRPNGECIDGIGITPDYEVLLENQIGENGEVIGVIDTQLNKAVEILNSN